MQAKIISTGSKGNAVLLNGSILIDCGLPMKQIRPYEKDLKLVFISHCHSDHFNPSTIRRLAMDRPLLRFCGGEWMAPLFVSSGVKPGNIDILQEGTVLDYGAFKVSPVKLYHDVPNFGLRIGCGCEKAIYAVDTGSMDGIEAKNYDLYMIERNHNHEEIEARIKAKEAIGMFAYEKRAEKTHLSEEQAIEWLEENMGENSQYVFLHQHREE